MSLKREKAMWLRGTESAGIINKGRSVLSLGLCALSKMVMAPRQQEGKY